MRAPADPPPMTMWSYESVNTSAAISGKASNPAWTHSIMISGIGGTWCADH
jgi:hypothetical protein